MSERCVNEWMRCEWVNAVRMSECGANEWTICEWVNAVWMSARCVNEWMRCEWVNDVWMSECVVCSVCRSTRQVCVASFRFESTRCHDIRMSYFKCGRGMSHVNKSCHVWTSHVTYEWVMSRMNESCHVWMSHVTYEWVMSHMNESCHIRMSHVTYEWVMSRHIWMSHVTYECVMSHMNEASHLWINHITYEWVKRHIWMSHVTYERVMSLYIQIRMSRVIRKVTHMKRKWPCEEIFLDLGIVLSSVCVSLSISCLVRFAHCTNLYLYTYYRVAKTHRMPCLHKLVSAKERYN